MTDVIDTPTAEEINQHFNACGHSVDLINGIIAGTDMADESQEDKNDAVDRNVRHLEIQVAKDWYTADSESRTAPADKASITAAITAGNSYLA
jgi:hypothetical protein